MNSIVQIPGTGANDRIRPVKPARSGLSEACGAGATSNEKWKCQNDGFVWRRFELPPPFAVLLAESRVNPKPEKTAFFQEFPFFSRRSLDWCLCNCTIFFATGETNYAWLGKIVFLFFF